MAQYLRPDNDRTNYGWSPSTGSTLYECVDEETGSDTDYIYNDTASQVAELDLSPVTDPESSSGHTCRWRWKATGSTAGEKLDFILYCDGAFVAYLANAATVPRSWTAASYTLLSTEADAITDYEALYVRLSINTIAASGEQIAVSWIEMEVPNAPSPGGDVSDLMLLGVG